MDKELGQRYRSDEALQGETFTSFKKRVLSETIESLENTENKTYPAWVRMPNETIEQFKKRLVAKKLNESKKFSAWEKLPYESENDFKKRLTSKRLE